jgi:hypothetical protein
MKILTILLIIFSIIGGFSINGEWSFLYQFEFIDYPKFISTGQENITGIIGWVLLLIGHCGIIVLPFITRKHYFWPVVVGSPLLFIIAFVAMATVFALLFLAPFILVWIIALALAGNSRQIKHVI